MDGSLQGIGTISTAADLGGVVLETVQLRRHLVPALVLGDLHLPGPGVWNWLDYYYYLFILFSSFSGLTHVVVVKVCM